jgi:hypothetical protein
VPDLPPHYNIAPSQFVAVVGDKPDGGGRGLVLRKILGITSASHHIW